MIPRAVQQMFRVTEDLRPRGWEYKMEGQFLEIVSDFSRANYARRQLIRATSSIMKQSMTYWALVK